MAYSYIRFSTPDQEKGDSLRRQIQGAEKWAAENGFELDDKLRFKDLGVSAFHGHHRTKGRLGQFLQHVEDGKIRKGSILIVESLDRLSREEILDALNQFTGIIGAGIKVVTLSDGMEYDAEGINANFGQLMMSLVIMSRAHEESSIKSKRLSEAWAEKRANINNKKLTSRAPAWLQLSEDRTEFTPIPERVKIIQRIYRMKQRGFGAERIAKRLNEQQVQWIPKNGWRKSYINKILRTPAVIGEYQPHRKVNGKRIPEGEPIADYFPVAIETGLFATVQKQFKANRGKTGRTGKAKNLFTHIAKCGLCGAPMQFVDKGKTWQYLVCDTHRRGMGCQKNSFPYPVFKGMIVDYILRLKPENIISDDGDQAELNKLKEGREATLFGLERIESQMNNVTDSIADTADKRVRQKLGDRMSKMLDEQEALNQQLEKMGSEIERLSTMGNKVAENLSQFHGLVAYELSIKSPEERIDFRLKLKGSLRNLIQRIEIYPPGPLGTPEYDYVRDYFIGLHQEGTGVWSKAVERYKQIEDKTGYFFQLIYKSGVVHGVHCTDDREKTFFERWSYFGEGRVPRLYVEQ